MQIWNTARRNQRHPQASQDQIPSQSPAPRPQLSTPERQSAQRRPASVQTPPNRRRSSTASTRSAAVPVNGVNGAKTNGNAAVLPDTSPTQFVASKDTTTHTLTILKSLLHSDDVPTDLTTVTPAPDSNPDEDLKAIIEKLSETDIASLEAAIGQDQDIFTFVEAAEATSADHDNDITAPNYEDDIEKFRDLHVSIEKCNSVLASVEDYLSLFESDLSLLSSEIETLQNRSIFLNRRLENRKELELQLSALIDDVLIPPHTIKSIVSGEINLKWIDNIELVFTRLKRVELFKTEARHITDSVVLIDELEPVLKMLADKAVERVRDFFVQKIKSLRAPTANAQLIQYNVLLKYRRLFAFIVYVNPQLAEDISQGYVNTMKWYYSTSFGRYLKALEKMKVHTVDRSGLLGAADSTRTQRPPVSSAVRDPLILGRRVNVVFSTDSTVILESAAENNAETHWMETGFRSFNLALMDNVCAEYLFIVDFFGYKTSEQQSLLFQDIFQPAFQLGEAYLHKLIETALFDALGLLLCIRVVQLLEFELQRRKVPVMEAYCNRLNMVLWPRFQIVMDAHSDQLRKLSGRPPINADEAKGSLASAGTAAWKATASLLSSAHVSSVLPHPVTQRFANFLNGILELSPEDLESEPVSVSVVRLRNEFEAFLTKISTKIVASASTGSTTPRVQQQHNASMRERFLYNNYMLVYTIISDSEGRLAEQEKAHFKVLTEAYATQSAPPPASPQPA